MNLDHRVVVLFKRRPDCDVSVAGMCDHRWPKERARHGRENDMVPSASHCHHGSRRSRLAREVASVLFGGALLLAGSAAGQPPDRSGRQVVDSVCISCHGTSTSGAPRVGDTAAWIPRLKQGMDAAVRSAIKGHGGMPARGGRADLTDAEFRSAVVYMINPNFASVTAKATTSAAPAAGNDYRVVDGTGVYFGAIPADIIRRNPKDYPAKAYGVAPMGPDQYYVTIALFDSASGMRISDAAVRARVSTANSAGPEKALELVTVADSATYGNYFAMGGAGPFAIAVHIKRPGAIGTIETKFEYTR
jgi:cytochrome c5